MLGVSRYRSLPVHMVVWSSKHRVSQKLVGFFGPFVPFPTMLRELSSVRTHSPPCGLSGSELLLRLSSAGMIVATVSSGDREGMF